MRLFERSITKTILESLYESEDAVYNHLGERCPKCGSGNYFEVDGAEYDDGTQEFKLVCADCGYESDVDELNHNDLNEAEEVKEEKKVTKVEVLILPTIKFMWAEGNQDHIKALFGSAEEHDMDFSKFQNAVYMLDQEVSNSGRGGYDKVKYVANIQVKFTYEDGSTSEETSTYTGRVDCGDGYKYVTVSKNMQHFIQDVYKDAEVIVKEDDTAELKESAETGSGMSIKEYAMNYFDGDIDIDVTDTEIFMLVAFVNDFNEEPKDNYDRFLNLLGERTKVVKVDNNVLTCDFSSVFKPYEDKLQDFFNMDYSDYNEAYYEAVSNLEPLISGNAGEKTYGELIDILNSKQVTNEADNLESLIDEAARYLFNEGDEDYLPDYEEFNDSIMEISKDLFDKAKERALEALTNLAEHQYYDDDGGYGTVLELNDNHTIRELNNENKSYEEWASIVNSKQAQFKADTDVDLLLLGRMGRHACVEPTYDNCLNFNYLQETQERLEREAIDEFNGKQMNESVDIDKFKEMVSELHSYIEAGPDKISRDLKAAIKSNKLEDYLKHKAAMSDEEISNFKKKYSSESINESFDVNKVAKRVARYKEPDKHVFHSWYEELSPDKAEEMARQASLENPEDVFYVQYDDIMNGSSEYRYVNGVQYNINKGGFHWTNGLPKFHTDADWQAVYNREKTWEEIDTMNESVDNDPDLDADQVQVDVDYWTDIDEADIEDVSNAKPIGVYTVSNNSAIYVYQIEYDIEDRVLVGDSSDETKAKWEDIIYGDGEAYFWYGDIKVPFNDVVRTDI